jgi:Lanthionine synthetase C-like protein/HopA1 effector protein family
MHPDIQTICDDLELQPEGRFALVRGHGKGDWPAGVRFANASDIGDERFAQRHQASVVEEAAVSTTPSAEGAKPEASSPMARVLSSFLYDHYYLRPSTTWSVGADIVAARDFRHALARASPNDQVWQSGFNFVSTAGGAVVERDGLRFSAQVSAVRPVGGPGTASELRPGDRCSVLLPRQYRWRSPGYHLVVGAAEAQRTDRAVRLYWHLSADQAPKFLDEAITRLDQAGLPFTIKVLHSADLYGRADAGVLYLARRDVAAARPVIRALHNLLAPDLRSETPRFTKHLAPGLGLAEDPSNGDSFGMHLCRMIAGALTTSYDAGLRDSTSRTASVTAAFRRAEIPLDTPYLSPGSTDNYDTLLGQTAHSRESKELPIRGGSPDPTTTPPSDLLAAAKTLGEQLCRSAIWDKHQNRCTWVGRSNPATTEQPANHEPLAAAVDAYLYGGLSGISLFLAELYGVTREPDFARTARGALAAALSSTTATPTDQPGRRSVALYTGLSGTALIRHRVSRLLGLPLDGHETVLALADELTRPDDAWVDDLLAGRAGVILALLALNRLGDPLEEALSQAIRIGEHLCRAGVEGWRSARDDPTLLTGLSHGASGIGLAMLELHSATGIERFLAAGRDAFAYEDGLFDQARNNWPDLRKTPGAGALHTAVSLENQLSDRVFGLAWCHGAPGIALARLRAQELDDVGHEHHLEAARAGLASTARAVDDLLSGPDGLQYVDLTPCHGLTGLVESLAVGGERLPDPDLRDIAQRAGRAVAAAVKTGPLQSGTLCGGPNPSLMLGTAGVGHTLLRLYAPTQVPSILLVT